DVPQVLRYDLNRMCLVEDAWCAKEGENMLADLTEKISDSRLALYPLLGSDLALRFGANRVKLMIRLARVVDLGTDSGKAARELTKVLVNWEKQTGVLSRYRAAPEMQALIPNLPL